MKLSPRYSACAMALAITLATHPSEAQNIEYARPADSFVDSIGVNVHLGYNDVAYWNYDGITKPRLLELGVRHIRGGINNSTDPVAAKYQDLGANGIKTTMIINVPANVVSIITALPNAITAVEGPNEVDGNSGWKYNNVGFPVGLRNFMTALDNNVKGNAATKHIPVVGPSLINPNKWAELGPVACDYGNVHSYQGGDVPDEDLYYNIFMAGASFGNKPIIFTETGYYTYLNNQHGISDTAHAKYIPRLFLENFRAGIPRTFSYEFIDSWSDSNGGLDGETPESHFGLLSVSGPGDEGVVATPKPAFTALKNLITLLKDPGAPFTPGTLDFKISGTDQYKLRHLLLQKRDGSFWLVIWQNVKNYNPVTETEINPAPKSVTLTFNQTVGSITTYSPNISLTGTGGYNTTLPVTLPVTDVPLLVKISNIGAPTGATSFVAHPASYSAADAFLTALSPFTSPNNGYGNYYEEGRVGDKDNVLGYRQVMKFTLPPLPAGRTVSSAKFTFRLVSKTGSPTHGVNLVVYESPVPHIVNSDWAGNTLLTSLGTVLTPSSPVNTSYEVTNPHLARAIRHAYASKLKHISLRFQLPDGVYVTGGASDDYYRIGSIANDTENQRPKLELFTSPISTTLTVSPTLNSDGALIASAPYTSATTLVATGSTAHIGSHLDDKAYRTFYKFVLPSIPNGMTISSARLNFRANSYLGSPQHSVVLSSYEPSNAILGLGDWNDTTEGVELGPIMTVTTPSGSYPVTSGKLSQAILDAYGRSKVNFGFRLKLDNGQFLGGAPGNNTYYSVGTQDNTTVTNRPTLQIDFFAN